MALFFIYTVFMISFFGNSLVAYGIIPPQSVVVLEAVIYVLFAYSLARKDPERVGFHFHLSYIFGFFVLVAFCSTILNHYYSLRPIYSLRLVLRFYVMYLAIINLDLDDDKLQRINRVLFFLFILQLPVSAIKFSIYGVSELTMGSYTVRGGGSTTLIPIIALGYLAGYYVFYKARVLYLVLAIAFVMYGIVGAKAALLILYPIAFFGIYYLVYIRGKGLNLVRDLSMIACMAIFVIATGAAILKLQPRLNPERKVGGSIDLSYALEYTQKYVTGMSSGNPDLASGRIATTRLVFEHLWEGGIPSIFFGYGPGCLSGSILEDEMKIDRRIGRIAGSYGKTGMVYILTEYGLFGLIPLGVMFFVFFRMCWKYYKYETDSYWKGFAAGAVVFAVLDGFIFFTYNTVPLLGDTIPPVYFYAMATVYTRMKRLKSVRS